MLPLSPQVKLRHCNALDPRFVIGQLHNIWNWMQLVLQFGNTEHGHPCEF